MLAVSFSLRAFVLQCVVLPGVLLLGASWSSPLHAVQTPSSIPWENGRIPCWDAAGAFHGVDPWLLYAIGYVESHHNPSSISKPNKNGTVDIGMMQINSVWLPELRRWGVPQGALVNACASTYIGAWIMAKNIRRYGYTWEAIAAYNVGTLDTPRRRQIGKSYATRVYEAYGRLVRR